MPELKALYFRTFLKKWVVDLYLKNGLDFGVLLE